jgi:hypothetical protein
MSPPPFIFIATNRLRPGRLDRDRKRVPGLVEFIKANEPRLIRAAGSVRNSLMCGARRRGDFHAD